MFRLLQIASLLILAATAAQASPLSPEPAGSLPDSICPAPIPPVEKQSRGLISKIIDYFSTTNKPKPYKEVDFSLIGGPFYSSDTKFGIGLVGAALYHAGKDSLVQASDVSLKCQASTTLFAKCSITGNHFFPGDRCRIIYDFSLSLLPTYYWGIGYENARNDSHKTKYRNLTFSFNADVPFRIAPNLFAGPSFDLNYIIASRIRRPEIFGDLPTTTTSVGAGIVFQYDTRDVVSEPHRGINARLVQRFYPSFLGNSNHSFSETSFFLAGYFPVWKGGILAARLGASFTYGDTPWGMMPHLGGSSTMRGYYEGRYRDKCAGDITVELRQNVWRRNGVVVWVGAGNVFPNFKNIRLKQILPNYGFGYRWQFKQRMNVRIDVGFGRGEWGVEFNINEAF